MKSLCIKGANVMKEARFIAKNKERWAKMEKSEGLETDVLAMNFTTLSDDLAYAKTFYPKSDVVPYLNGLLAAYQENIYRYREPGKRRWFSFWTRDFPLLIYREKRMMCFALLFFCFTCLIGLFSAAKDSDFVRLILGDRYVNMTLDNIARGKPMGVYDSMDGGSMFIAITLNNIKVSFVIFVYGILCVVGTLFALLQNGVMLGSFQYFFYERGLFLHSVLSVWAHGTFEITSIVIAGGAGLVMGASFLFPGTYGRLQSFRMGALKGIKLIVGLIPFFIIAGAIESFVTRYADAHPVVGVCAIVASLAGVVGYFIVYPFYVNKYYSNVEN